LIFIDQGGPQQAFPQFLPDATTFSSITSTGLKRLKVSTDANSGTVLMIIQCLRMLLEGYSIRSVERLTGVHRDTIISAMVGAGIKCKAFMESVIQNVPVTDVQVDEIWGFIFRVLQFLPPSHDPENDASFAAGRAFRPWSLEELLDQATN
jgi:hypothetical protein